MPFLGYILMRKTDWRTSNFFFSMQGRLLKADASLESI